MVSWGIIGPGHIARVFCNGLRFSRTGEATAVASRDKRKAESFADMFTIPIVHDSYEDLLTDDNVDAVYVATIHPAHLEWAIKAAVAGKHVLVEKPMGMDTTEVISMIEAAKSSDVFLMEAFMYRCHPQIERLSILIQEGAIGDVRMVRSSFGYNADFASSNTFDHGGIMDVGCYAASASRLVAGAASGQPFLNPIEIKAAGVVSDTGVDCIAAASLLFENDVVGQISTSITCNLPSEIVVFGTEGVLRVPEPWLPSTPCRGADSPLPLDTAFPPSEILLSRRGQQETIMVEVNRDLFTYEADVVAEYIDARQTPTMSWEDSLGNMQLMDEWRSQIGVVFPEDVV